MIYLSFDLGYLSGMTTLLSDGAKKELLDLIKRRGVLSLEEAIDELKLAKTTIRQHLLAMEGQGLIKRSYQRAGQGRPKVVFELAQGGQRLYPTQEPMLLRELLEFLKSNDQRDTIARFFEKYWDKREEQFEAILASLPGKKNDIETRLEALRILLESEGFMPQIERKGSKITVRECHCPYPEAIRATQLPCKLEAEFIKRALKIVVERVGYIPSGDAACTYTNKSK